MSQTISVDVFEPGYWSYMAAVMAEQLQETIQLRRIDPERIPKGVYRDALQFFGLVLGAVGDSAPENPPASINAYLVAADVVRGSSRPTPISRQDLKALLGKYSSFVDALARSRQLGEEEVVTAIGVKEFFEQLHREAEASEYERVVRLDRVPAP
jgi:hypothetical protein